LFCLVAILLLFLAYSEALKNISAYLLIGFFLWSAITREIKISKDIINIAIISHLFIVIIGSLQGINSNESLSQVMDLVHIVFLFLFFREANLIFLSYERIVQLIFIGFSFAALAGLFIFFSNSLSRVELHSVASVNRSSVYMVYIFVTAICLITYYNNNKFSKFLFPFVLLLSLISILLGASRMALFSLPVLIFLYGVFSNKINLTFVLISVLFFSLISIVIFLVFPDSLVAKKIFLGFEDTPRIQIWVASLYTWFENNLLFGIGIGNSISIDVAYYFDENALTRNIDNPHNVYLDMLLERGLLGLISFLTFMASFFFIKSLNIFSIYVRLLVISLLLMGIANITFRYEFALLFVILLGAYLNPSIDKKS